MLNGRRSPSAMWTLFRNSLCLSKEFSVTLKRPGSKRSLRFAWKTPCPRRNRSALPSRLHLGQIIHQLYSVDRPLCIDIDLWHVASTNTHCPTELKARRSYNQCRGTWTTCTQSVFLSRALYAPVFLSSLHCQVIHSHSSCPTRPLSVAATSRASNWIQLKIAV